MWCKIKFWFLRLPQTWYAYIFNRYEILSSKLARTQKLHFRQNSYMFNHINYTCTYFINFCEGPTCPWFFQKHILVQSCVKRTSFSNQNYFFGLIKFQTSSTWMNLFFYYIRFLIIWNFFNLQNIYTNILNRANVLSLSGKKGDTTYFFMVKVSWI